LVLALQRDRRIDQFPQQGGGLLGRQQHGAGLADLHRFDAHLGGHLQVGREQRDAVFVGLQQHVLQDLLGRLRGHHGRHHGDGFLEGGPVAEDLHRVRWELGRDRRGGNRTEPGASDRCADGEATDDALLGWSVDELREDAKVGPEGRV